ncbi:MAG: beta-propeller fold lactonase family protein [Bdellovibrionaceae bacterium]|nr:beta-propeller fold lactonase family protein [Bdellovibrio sp.]
MQNVFKFLYAGFAILSLTQCAAKDSFAPSDVKPLLKTVTANGGGALYCSISGGCPLSITGSEFYNGAKVFIGSYECLNTVISETHDRIDCEVGPGKSGLFDIRIRNRDGNFSVIDKSVTDPTAIQFAYASFLYLGVQDSPGKVYGYAQNPVTGALLSIPSSPYSIPTSANQTYGTVISPNNKFLYAANVLSGTVSTFSIKPQTGQLTAVGPAVVTGGTVPNGLFFHPSGNYLYVTNQGGNSVSVMTVAADGTLTAIGGSPFSAAPATSLNGIVVDSTGRFLYVASMGGTGGVVGYAIDSNTGALSLISGSPFKNTNGAFANTGDGITIHQNGRWLYMGLVGVKRVAAFDIDQSTGALTGIGTPILNNSTTGYTDNGGSGANISPDGLFFYGTAFSTTATHPKKVIVYNINQSTGQLSLASEADAGGGPNDIRVDTNGNFAYTCNSSNTPSVSAYSRNPANGALTPLTPRDISIPTGNGGPGIMVIQK